jgi:U2 small nuclear ribonucleoprotein B''
MSFIIPIIPVGTKPQRKPMAPPPTTPQSTLYVRNLPETKKLEDLKTELTNLFSKYGKLVDLKVKHNIKHRGQAFVSFETIDEATRAKDELYGMYNCFDGMLY